MHRITLRSGALGLAAFALSSTALAGGLERHGYDVDLLFEKSPYVFDGTVTYVMPNREIKNAVDTDATDGILSPATGFSSSADGYESYIDPYLGAKAAIGDSVDCMIDYSQPWGANSNPGKDWVGAQDMTEIEVFSHNYGASCSYKFDAGPGQFRIIGGGFYQEIGGHKEALVFSRQFMDFVGAVTGNDFSTFSGLGRLEDMKDSSGGWRAGLGYEISEYAMRASLVYNSKVNYDNVDGTLDLTQVPDIGGTGNPIFGADTPVTGSATLPESLELKLQSGIAPDWLAFGSIKWTNWSRLQTVPFRCDPRRANPAVCAALGGQVLTSLDLYYRDGWTTTGGLGHKFNEQWSGGASITWDRGTSTIVGSQSDTWSLGLGGAYTPTENVELRFGGLVGLMTSGESQALANTKTSYEYGTDFVSALSAELKVKF